MQDKLGLDEYKYGVLIPNHPLSNEIFIIRLSTEHAVHSSKISLSFVNGTSCRASAHLN